MIRLDLQHDDDFETRIDFDFVDDPVARGAWLIGAVCGGFMGIGIGMIIASVIISLMAA